MVLEIKKDEYGRFFYCFAILILLEIGAGLSSVALQTMIVKRMGLEYLALSYILMNAVALGGTAFYTLFGYKLSGKGVFYLFSIFAALLLLAVRLLISDEYYTSPELDWHMTFFVIAVIFARRFFANTLWIQTWIICNNVFTFSQFRRLNPYLLVTAQLGGIIAGLLVQVIVPTAGMGGLIVDWGISFLLIALVYSFFYKKYGKELKSAQEHQSSIPEEQQNWRSFLRYALSSKTFFSLIIIIIFYTLVMSVKDFQYTQAMNDSYDTETALAQFFGLITIIISITGLFIQFVISKRLILTIGIFKSLAVLPLVCLLCFIILTLHFGYWQAILLYYCWQVFSDALHNNAYQLSFNTAPPNYRSTMRNFCSGTIRALGGLLGGLFLLFYLFIFDNNMDTFATNLLSIIGIILCAGWILTALYGRKFYVSELVNFLSIKNRSFLLDSLDALEERKEEAAYKALLSVLRSTQNIDYGIQSKVMEVLSRLGNIKAIGILTYYLRSPHDELRMAAIKALTSFRGIEKHKILLYFVTKKMQHIFMHDPHKDFRLEAGQFLVRHQPKENVPKFADELLNHRDPSVRILAIQTLPSLRLDHIDMLICDLLYDPDPIVRKEAAVTLWDYSAYTLRVENAVKEILQSKDENDQKAGLEVLLRIKAKDSFMPLVVPLLTSKDMLTKALAILVALSHIQQKDEKWSSLMHELLDIVADPHFNETQKQQLLTLIPYAREDVLDVLMSSIQQLSEEKRIVAQKGMDQLADILSKQILTTSNF